MLKAIVHVWRAGAAALILIFLAPAIPAAAGDGLSAEMRNLRASAEAGNAAAQFRLATAYDWGQGAPRGGAQAKRWYSAAAEQGMAEAQNSLGSALQAEKRYEEARSWYEKAASQRSPPALNNLAYLYDVGLGVAQDRAMAFGLYSQSADLGWAEAMWNLSVMYGAGQVDGAPDLAQACAWTLRARNNARGNAKILANADRAINFLRTKLSGAQWRDCENRGTTWSPKAVH